MTDNLHLSQSDSQKQPLFGCFVDIRQQDGSLSRMLYPLSRHREVEWIGIHEQTAAKFLEGAMA